MRGWVAVLAVVVGAVACTDTMPSDEADAPAFAVAQGWSAELVRDDLDRPTQIAIGADGSGLVVGELAGGEDEGAGRVRGLSADGTGDPSVLAGSLLTPTGVAFLDGRLVVQEQDLLVQFPRTDEDEDEVLGDLAEGEPPNGRSQGTLTPIATDAGPAVLATVTGRGSGPDVGDTGELRAVRPTGDVVAVAVGFKNAYAHAIGPDGKVYVTEIGDGTYDGEAPPGELHVLTGEQLNEALAGGEPYDGGWPRCTGDGDPTEEFGVTAAACAELPGPLALFPPGSTPTSVTVTDDGRVLVALWVDGRVVEVDADTGDVTDVLTGIDQPQHLLALPDGDVLLTVHATGELWRLTPPAT